MTRSLSLIVAEAEGDRDRLNARNLSNCKKTTNDVMTISRLPTPPRPGEISPPPQTPPLVLHR